MGIGHLDITCIVSVHYTITLPTMLGKWCVLVAVLGIAGAVPTGSGWGGYSGSWNAGSASWPSGGWPSGSVSWPSGFFWPSGSVSWSSGSYGSYGSGSAHWGSWAGGSSGSTTWGSGSASYSG